MSRSDPRRVLDYLQHILDTIENIQNYTAGARWQTIVWQTIQNDLPSLQAKVADLRKV